MKQYLIFHKDVQEQLNSIIKAECLAESLHDLIKKDCKIYIVNRTTYEAVRKRAFRKGFSMPEYVSDLIALARMQKGLDRLRYGITPLRDRGYNGASCSSMEGSHSYLAAATPKRI